MVLEAFFRREAVFSPFQGWIAAGGLRGDSKKIQDGPKPGGRKMGPQLDVQMTLALHAIRAATDQCTQLPSAPPPENFLTWIGGR